MCMLHSFDFWKETQKMGCKSTQAQKMQHTPDTHQRTVHPAAGGGGRAGCRLDHGAWVGVEEWVGRCAQCFRARGVQRIRCCNRIRKLACERASRWKTALRSSAKMEPAAVSSPIVAVQILSNSWINRKPLCVLFYDCKKFSSNCCHCDHWLILRTCECVWSWRTAGKVKQCLFDSLDCSFHLCVNRAFTDSRKLPCGVKDDIAAYLQNTHQSSIYSRFLLSQVSHGRRQLTILEMFCFVLHIFWKG